ncbi:MAG: hypothetical protein L0216_10870 [Planctomycetales bacterium]|nr:hypothetical protein [Planctomycetales bacterium]
MPRRILLLLLILAVALAPLGCYHLHPDYRTFYLTGKYQEWAEREDLFALYPLVNPVWWIGVAVFALDLVISPFTLLYDLGVWISAPEREGRAGAGPRRRPRTAEEDLEERFRRRR